MADAREFLHFLLLVDTATAQAALYKTQAEKKRTKLLGRKT